jgi:hypothetical protein
MRALLKGDDLDVLVVGTLSPELESVLTLGEELDVPLALGSWSPSSTAKRCNATETSTGSSWGPAW